MKKGFFCIIIASTLAIVLGGCASNNMQPLIKQVAVRGNSAQVQFQPGPVKYEVEYKDRKAVLIPSQVTDVWGNNSFGAGLLHTFRPIDGYGGYDEIWLTTKDNGSNEDMEIKVSVFLEDGSVSVKKIYITDGEPRLISIGDNKLMLALQHEPAKP